MSKTFNVAGVSTGDDGVTKMRFANDKAKRIKVLLKYGHEDIVLVDLPKPMSKADALTYLMTDASTEFNDEQMEVISEANYKYNIEPAEKAKRKAERAAKRAAKEAEKNTVKVTKKKEEAVAAVSDSEQAKRDARNARRRELRAMKKAAAEAAAAEKAEA